MRRPLVMAQTDYGHARFWLAQTVAVAVGGIGLASCVAAGVVLARRSTPRGAGPVVVNGA